MTTADEYAIAICEKGGWVATTEKRMGIVAWGLAEGNINVPEFSGATWNILDTTEPATGATDFNNVGVKNYPDEATGVEAVVATLTNGYYNNNILPVLENEGASATMLATAVGNSPWGTGDFTNVLNIVKGNPVGYLAMAVPGSSDTPAPPPEPAPDPTPPPPAPPIERGNMVSQDPITGGTWVTDVNGDVYAEDGARYLGGLNTHPEWNAGGAGALGPCVGIAPWHGDGTDTGGNGYVLACQTGPGAAPSLYRFPGDGSLKGT